MREDSLVIAGAGPAGLAAAITLAKAGRNVTVHEAQPEVGMRFQGDLQGLENWSSQTDILDEFSSYGLSLDFKRHSAISGTAFDAWGKSYSIKSQIPLFYTIERGPGFDTLDNALLRQATSLGVKVQFNSRLKRLPGKGILATGPKRADAIAVGYHFKTDLENGFWLICDDNLAPDGYSYLLVLEGNGTVKSCMFSDFKREKLYVERTIKAFEKLVGLKMENQIRHGGFGNFNILESAQSGSHPIVGEQSGFQDTLWGFGIRFAVLSGVMAAKSLIEGKNYDQIWMERIRPALEVSVVNRAFYSLIGNRGYRWALRNFVSNDNVRQNLCNIYRPSKLKRLLLPIAKRRFKSRRDDISCNHSNCDCIWCRHCSADIK